MHVCPAILDRFRNDLDQLAPADARLGIAVSGGPDSLALLLLASGSRPGKIEAATVDHALRPSSRDEAEFVAEICKQLDVPHSILTVDWQSPPATALQERARSERYRHLADWAGKRDLEAITTAHHLDDQAETFVMRAGRGAGVKGLSAMRALATVPGSDLPLLRPLLGWRRSELAEICADASLLPVEDPSNVDDQFERVRVRRALEQESWLDPAALARSAAHLADADTALEWATGDIWDRAVTRNHDEILFRHDGAPSEIRRRIVARAISALAREGDSQLRGRELDQLTATLLSGAKATLRGVLCEGGAQWRFVPAPDRTRREQP